MLGKQLYRQEYPTGKNLKNLKSR